jgi:hypothetical protein
MDDIAVDNCTIESAAVHVVNNREADLELADEPLTLNDELVEFLRKHIAASVAQSSVALFNDRKKNEVSVSCEEVFEDPVALVKSSKKLATRLFDFMRPKTINPGTFWTILFRDEIKAAQYLALMKMDDISTFRYGTVTKSGKKVINLKQEAHTLPNTKMKLDKGAFIIPAAAKGFDYELRVLDKKLPEEMVATYFTEFLSFRAPQTDLDKTRIFMTAVESWINENRATLPKTIKEQQLREFKRAYLNNNEEVRPKDFATAAFGDQHPTLSSSLLKHLRDNKLRDPQFKVHQNEWNKHSGKLTYRLTSGNKTLEIKGDLEAMRTMMKITEPTAKDPHYYALITADSLAEV